MSWQAPLWEFSPFPQTKPEMDTNVFWNLPGIYQIKIPRILWGSHESLTIKPINISRAGKFKSAVE